MGVEKDLSACSERIHEEARGFCLDFGKRVFGRIYKFGLKCVDFVKGSDFWRNSTRIFGDKSLCGE